ncbi:MAG: TonB-dependent receptor [Bacteroidetes bacterium]|jgi:outer membrane receptor for ferrienterochelin and colicins|nr:TonB-dependent receptor [Bacteroidota bacterium]
MKPHYPGIPKRVCTFYLFFSLYAVLPAYAQHDHAAHAAHGSTPHLMGQVLGQADGEPVPLYQASLQWRYTETGTYTDTAGFFHLIAPPQLPWQLGVQYAGYAGDTLRIESMTPLRIVLPPLQLDGIQVQGRVRSTEILALETRKIEQLGTEELFKAACCNLSESFETNATVDASMSDAITGTRDIRMLGLDGMYTQLTTEAQAYPRGLERMGALAYVPGAWVRSLEISKGVGSVVQGYEATSGQINLTLKQPMDAEKLYVNLYASDMGRTEANLNAAQRLGRHLSTIQLVHGSRLQQNNDQNGDRFLDVPRSEQYNLASRWKYQAREAGSGLVAHWGVHHYYYHPPRSRPPRKLGKPG